MKFLQVQLLRVVPVCFVMGASIELFMIKTGFYDIVTMKEAERRAERALQEREKMSRLSALNIKLEDGNVKK